MAFEFLKNRIHQTDFLESKYGMLMTMKKIIKMKLMFRH